MDMLSFVGDVEFQNIHSFSIRSAINRHGYMVINGIISKKNAEEYEYKSFKFKKIQILIDKNKRKELFFSGLIKKLQIKFVDGIYKIKVICVTYTYLFDVSLQSRSFQDINAKFNDIINIVSGNKGKITIIDDGTKKVNKPLIQYNETNWQFILRLASYLHKPVIPEIRGDYPQLIIGVADSHNYSLTNYSTYEIVNNLSVTRTWECFSENRNNIFFNIKSFDDFDLGDKVLLNKYLLIVIQKKSYFSDGLIENNYIMAMENSIYIPDYYNYNIIGVCLSGKVIDTDKEKVKIHLNIDIQQKKEYAFWYPFAPETGNILYCMPEIGSDISLYFPDKDESNAIAINCRNSKENDDLNNAIKYLHSEKDKYFIISPEIISFSFCKNNRFNSVSLIDKIGVSFNTSKTMRIFAKQKISFFAGGMIENKSNNKLSLLHNDYSNFINISNAGINLNSNRIVYCGNENKIVNQEIKDCETIENENINALSQNLLAGIPINIKSYLEASLFAAIAVLSNPKIDLNILTNYLGVSSVKNKR